jgi:hypothetical protein
MPPRLVCVTLLLYWLVAAVGLVSRDLLPELSVGAPPDLRTIANAGEHALPARWTIQVVDDPAVPEARRTVGQAVTASRLGPGGCVEMTSAVTFDSGRLLGGLMKVAPGQRRVGEDDQIEFFSSYQVDPSGNLRSFHGEVRMSSQPEGLWRIDGGLKNGAMEVVSQGPLPFLNRTMSFPYHARGVVQSQFGPLDRLPGLQVGQRWDEQIVSPLTGRVETVRAEVKRRTMIHWDKSPVKTLEVVHTSKAVTARTFVRPDGLVLRQELSFPMLRLALERQPDRATAQDASPR